MDVSVIIAAYYLYKKGGWGGAVGSVNNKIHTWGEKIALLFVQLCANCSEMPTQSSVLSGTFHILPVDSATHNQPAQGFVLIKPPTLAWHVLLWLI